jgi:hypothetical protein
VIGGLPTGDNSSIGAPNLACTISMVWPLTGRGSPDGVLGGALDIASISRVSALAEYIVIEMQVANNILNSGFMKFRTPFTYTVQVI